MIFSKIKTGGQISGFRIDESVALDELNATLIRLTHLATGARMVHMACDDTNNLFGVGFRTPPSDSTGVAHILEHTVLCGSRRFPVRDPFFAMLKRSLSSFMNALTSSDWTMYPFSSQNKKDFYNLLDVYLDAVFFPLLRERDFSQEGHRIEFVNPDDPASPLTYKGVVYNEMKGAMADPSSLLPHRLAEHLYPTTTYRFNSGGEPAVIPSLRYEDLKAFHARYYHPSNSYLFTYGDLPLEGHLEVIDSRALSHFQAIDPDSAVPPETRLGAPVSLRVPYPVEPGGETAGKAMVQLGWLTTEINDTFGTLALRVLAQLLLGNPAAPLYKDLLDSGLGANLAPGTGFHDESRTTYFAAGLQGTDANRTEKIEAVIMETLERISREGFSDDRIAGVIHRLEFSQREVTGDHYPYALLLMFRMFGSWIHADDPVTPLRLTEHLDRLRGEIGRGGFFEDLIRRHFLENPHRVTITLVPDPDEQRRAERQLARTLEEIRAGLDPAGIAAIEKRARELQEAQEADEDVSCLPTLQLEDIPREERRVEGVDSVEESVPVTWFDQPTNGILYITAFFEIDDVGPELSPYIPLFCSFLNQVGAGPYDYTEMAERLEAATGGVTAVPEILARPDDPEDFTSAVVVQGKALVKNQGKLIDLLGHLLSAPDFKDTKRLKTLLSQLRISLENSLPGSGHSFARGNAAAVISRAAALRERWSGISLVRFVKNLESGGDRALDELAVRLGELTRLLLRKERLSCAVTGERRHYMADSPRLADLFNAVAGGSGALPAAGDTPESAGRRRGWAFSVPVSYVARVFPGVPYTHEDAAPLAVLSRLMKAGYLHRELREKGGAYGAMTLYGMETGLFSMVSYRDPHIARTLKVYDDAARWAGDGLFSDEQIKEAILAVFSELDRPLSPAGRGRREFFNAKKGLTRQLRQEFRERALAVSRKDLVLCAEKYLVAGRPRSAVSVLAGREALEQASRKLGDEALTVETI